MKVGSYVDSARTISLVVIVLGYVGWDLGTQHSQRAALLAKARELLAAQWIRQQYVDDVTIVRKMIEMKAVTTEPKTGQLRQAKPFVVHSPIGDMEIRMRPVSRSASFSQRTGPVSGLTMETLGAFRLRFDVAVKGLFGSWSMSSLELADTNAGRQLARISGDLDLNRQDEPEKLLTAIEDKLYRRKVSVPSLDFAAFKSEQAVWLIAVLCFLALVVLRSRVRLIRLDPTAGIETPWLVLDARAAAEKLIAALWIAGILLSSWLACGALLFTEKDLMMATKTPPLGHATAVFLFVGALALASGWSALGTVCDLLKLRTIRVALHEAAKNVTDGTRPAAQAGD
jgi:hypothetical protein